MDRLLTALKGVHSREGQYPLTTLDTDITWNIPEDKYSTFWQSYTKIVDQHLPRCVPLYLAEKPRLHMPLIVNFRFKFPISREEDVEIPESFLLQLVSVVQQALETIFQLDEQRTQILCSLMDGTHMDGVPASPSASSQSSGSGSYYSMAGGSQDDSYYYLNYRLHFPYCKTESPFHTSHFRPYLIDLLRQKNSSLVLPIPFVNDWDDIVVINGKNPLPLYGSCIPRGPIYVHMGFIGPVPWASIQEESLIHTFEIDIRGPFAPHYHLHNEHVPRWNMEGESLLPVFLSIYYYPNITSPKTLKPLPSPHRSLVPIENSNEIDTARRFMLMLKEERRHNPRDLVWIGKALYNISEGSEEGLQMWKDFATGGIYNNDKCESLYYSYNNTPVSIKTLAWYAREDTPDQYEEWHQKWCSKAIEEATSGLTSDVGESLYRQYWLEFLVTEKGDWYQFRNNGWIKSEKGIDLQKRISNQYIRVFDQKKLEIGKILTTLNPEDPNHTSYTGTQMKYSKLITKLKSISFKTSLMREMIEKFHNEFFNKFHDRNIELVGVTNGVIELYENTANFRRGKPEDYLTMSTHIPYRTDFTKDHPMIRRLDRWICQTFVDPELRHYFCKDMASFLRGKNSEKKLRTWTGEGDNAKSVWIKCMEGALGDYVVKLPTSIMERRGQSSSANPELSRLINRHGAIIQETDSQDSMNVGILKELTGGDSFFARGLYESGSEVEATFKLILMCNKLPSIPNADKATMKRLLIIPFMSKWVHDAPEQEEQQFKERLFKIDLKFDAQIPEYSQALLWLMVDYYPRYCLEGLTTPDIVIRATQQYWNDHDLYYNYIERNLVEAKKEGSNERDMCVGVSVSEMYDQFKIWHKREHPGKAIPDSSNFKAHMEQRLGKHSTGSQRRWMGYRLREDDILGA